MHTKEYGNMKRYAQTVFSNHPIPPTSKTYGRWMVYKRYKNENIPHTEISPRRGVNRCIANQIKIQDNII